MQAVYKEGFWNFLSPPQDPALDFKGPAAGLISFLQKLTNTRALLYQRKTSEKCHGSSTARRDLAIPAFQTLTFENSESLKGANVFRILKGGWGESGRAVEVGRPM